VHVVVDVFARFIVMAIVPAAPVPCPGVMCSPAGWHVETPAAVDVVPCPVDVVAADEVDVDREAVVVVLVDPPPPDEQAASSTAPATTVPANRPDRRALTNRSPRV
jgi:hypothetical protein